MKQIFAIFCVTILTFSLIGCSSNEDDGKIYLPISSDDLKDANYLEIIDEFENAGFTNIKTEVIEDLLLGWFTKDGEVEEVSVDGDTSFSRSSRYLPDVEIIVSYHTFPEVEEEEIEDTLTPEPTVEIKATATPTSTEEIQPTAQLEIITIDNNEDFAALLNLSEPSNQMVSDFAKKYAGRIIEFDGNIAYMNNHGDYTTRYDFLIYAWDYSETSISGPSFQFEDCNTFDLNFIGGNIPDYVGAGDNLHIVARILDFDERSSLFHLDPISTKVR